MGRVLDKGDLVVREVDDMQLDVQRRGGLPGGIGGEERRFEAHALDFGAGLAENADGELRVESAGKE